MTPQDLLRYIARQPRVVLRESTLLDGPEAPVADPGELEGCLSALRESGDVCRWVHKGKPVVTLSSIAAYRFRLVLNPASTRWVEHGTPDPRDRNRPRDTVDGARVLCESDLGDDSAGMLAEIPDRRTEVVDDPDFGLARILGEEKRLGLVRPTLPLVGIQPWTARDSERDHDIHGKPFPGGGMGKAPKGGDGPCPVCNGRELREMIGLVTVRAGRNRAQRPPALKEGGEYCCRCGRIWNEDKWPKVTKLPAEKGRVTG